MTSQKRWSEIQQAMSEIETAEDAEEVHRMIRALPEGDPDRADLGQQLETITSGLEF